MSLAATNKDSLNFLSIRYWGQPPRSRDFPEYIRPKKEPETILEQCKLDAWTFLPILTLIKPVGSVVTLMAEAARTVKSVDQLLKSSSIKTTSYQAFRTFLSLGAMGSLFLENYSPLSRRICLGIKLLTIGHEIALAAHRIYGLQDNRYKVVKLCCHIINNILSLITIVRESPLSIFMFLAMQGMTGCLHAVRQMDKKDNYTAAGVHLFIAMIRFLQSYHIYTHLPQERRQMLIASSETVKENLTEHETIIKEVLGEKYLYFKRNGPKEKFLILTTEADDNKALNPLSLYSIIRTLSPKFDVKFRTISSIEDIEKEIQNASQAGRVMGLMLRTHGTPFSMILGPDSLLNAKTITSSLFSGLDPECVIVLDSCSTAKYPYFSIAYRVANLSQRITFACTNLTDGIKLLNTDPLEWNFRSTKIFIRTKKLVPFKDDKFITYLKDLFGYK